MSHPLASSVNPGDHSLPKANIPRNICPMSGGYHRAFAGGIAPDFRDTPEFCSPAQNGAIHASIAHFFTGQGCLQHGV